MIDTTPKVWLADLAAYNEGHLHGEWVDATDVENLREAGKRIIKSSPALYAEELAVHDYDNVPRAIIDHFGEYPNWDKLVEVLTALDDAYDREGFEAWLEADETALDDFDPERFGQVFRGERSSEE